MAGTGALRLGPVARRFVSPDRWTDGYPGPVAYSRELDVLLDWASKRNYLKRFVPNIEAKNTKRDEALNELRLLPASSCPCSQTLQGWRESHLYPAELGTF